MLTLPIELVISIARFLPVQVTPTWRLVCKSWCAVLDKITCPVWWGVRWINPTTILSKPKVALEWLESHTEFISATINSVNMNTIKHADVIEWLAETFPKMDTCLLYNQAFALACPDLMKKYRQGECLIMIRAGPDVPDEQILKVLSLVNANKDWDFHHVLAQTIISTSRAHLLQGFSRKVILDIYNGDLAELIVNFEAAKIIVPLLSSKRYTNVFAVVSLSRIKSEEHLIFLYDKCDKDNLDSLYRFLSIDESIGPANTLKSKLAPHIKGIIMSRPYKQIRSIYMLEWILDLGADLHDLILTPTCKISKYLLTAGKNRPSGSINNELASFLQNSDDTEWFCHLARTFPREFNNICLVHPYCIGPIMTRAPDLLHLLSQKNMASILVQLGPCWREKFWTDYCINMSWPLIETEMARATPSCCYFLLQRYPQVQKYLQERANQCPAGATYLIESYK